MLNVVYAMFYRQMRRFFRAKSRLIGTILTPLFFFLFFGMGFRAMNVRFLGMDYATFIAPGIIVMTCFTSSFIGGVSVIWDKEFGFLKEVLIAPAPRSYAILGRVIGDSLTSTFQAFMMLLLVLLIVKINLEGIFPTLIVCFITSLAFNSLGVAIASSVRSMEGFHLITNLLMFPLIFLSGAFYPVPDKYKIIFYMNPLTYSVDLARYFTTGISLIEPFFDFIVIIASSIAFLLLATLMFERIE